MVENGNSRPDGTPSIEQRIDNGRIFTIRGIDESGIGDGDTFSVLLTNPSDSGVNLLTVAPSISVTGEAFIEKIENPTIDTAGETLTPRNKKLESNRTAHGTAQTGGTNQTGSFSGGTSRGRQIVGGQSSKQAGSVGDIDLSLRIDPGSAIQYKVESNSSSNIVSVSVAFVEEPTTA